MENTAQHNASEKRHWVRITTGCNNHCMFCLDRDMLDGRALSLEEIEADLREGLNRGARRAIISGGEATIHPEFEKVVSMASRMGYTWVQTITNGRMFFYKKLLQGAVDSGLREVTFSMHGHNEELFDRLTGIKGSFKQALRGLGNALSMKNLVVSVDVVLNGLNMPHLFEIIQFYHALGVCEFDLLYPVPFGGAWEKKDDIFFNPDDAYQQLKKIFAYAAANNITVWTNRFPPGFLEGFESYIQPPEKVFDEVYGRREMFADYLEKDVVPPCDGERCAFCAMNAFCAMLARMKKVFAGAGAPFVVDADNVDSLAEIPEGLIKELFLDAPELLQKESVKKIVEKNNIPVTAIMKNWPENGNVPDGVAMEIEVNRASAPPLLKNGAPETEGVKTKLCGPAFFSLEECLERGTSLKTFFRHFSHDHGAPPEPVRNVPPCISGNRDCIIAENVSPDVRSESGGWDLDALTRHYLKYENFHKSTRCAGCDLNEKCAGILLNYARGFGFSELTPVKIKDYNK